MRRACLLSLFAVLGLPAAVLGLPAPALALPGDAPISPLEPTDGAVVPTNPDGIPVSFTCPEFRTSAIDPEFPSFGDSEDYFVGFATSPELGNNGLLRDDRLVDLGTSEPTNVGPEGRCVSAMEKDSALVGGVGPEETPGTYFWQVFRLCSGCETGFETGPVRSFTVRAPVTPDPLAELRAGKRPGARILGKSYKASKKWVVKITAKNPNGYKLKGEFTLKSGKAKFGSKSLSIAAKSNKTVRIRLSRRARSLLKRKRRLKVTAILKVLGPIGKSRTLKKRVVLRAPAKPKPKRGGGDGDGGGCTTTTYNPVTQQVEVVYKVPCPY